MFASASSTAPFARPSPPPRSSEPPSSSPSSSPQDSSLEFILPRGGISDSDSLQRAPSCRVFIGNWRPAFLSNRVVRSVFERAGNVVNIEFGTRKSRRNNKLVHTLLIEYDTPEEREAAIELFDNQTIKLGSSNFQMTDITLFTRRGEDMRPGQDQGETVEGQE
eukprot:GHVT01035901.1.p2 GENE.GHVT01035901.1~~GHVT01035901.1.p2  ORF type:complete len:164 (+),score=45.84 GHVT01035901.1:331-822(+)